MNNYKEILKTFSNYLTERFETKGSFSSDKYYHPDAVILYSDTQYTDDKNINALDVNLLGAISKGSVSIDTIKVHPGMGYIKWSFTPANSNDVIRASEFYVFREGKIYRQTVTLSKSTDLNM